MTNEYDYQRYAILYVDDEAQSLKYFRKAYEKEFRVLTASSASEAAVILEREGDEVGVLITDQRMPGQTGVDLLGKVRHTQPNVVRILTTAYSDLDSAIEAVNSGAIFRYVTKPWDIRDLRGVLLRAMEFFLVQQERDLLLREKLSVLQRIVITDRVRSLAVLAGGLAHHIRNSMTALRAFLDLAPVKSPQGPGAIDEMIGSAFRENLWTLAVEETERILKMVQQVVDTTMEPIPRFDATIPLMDLVSPELAQARQEAESRGGSLHVEIDATLPHIRVDIPMARRLFSLLLRRMVRLNGKGHKITLHARETVRVWNTSGLKISLATDGPAWTEDVVSSFFTVFAPADDDPSALDLDLLSAFFIAHHHGGDILVHRDRPDGPGFELHLPFDPESVERPSLEENCMEKLFTHFEVWDALRGES